MQIYDEVSCANDVCKIRVLCQLINVGENRRDIQEWTIRRHWQHVAHTTQDEDKHKADKIQYAEILKL